MLPCIAFPFLTYIYWIDSATKAETYIGIRLICQGIEKGKQVRIDCTVVASNIHEPKDSSLLWDCVRVLTRMLGQINERFDALDISFSDHTRRAKRRMLKIMNTNSKKVRDKKYEDLLKVTHMTVNYALTAVSLLEAHSFNHSSLLAKQPKSRLRS